MSLHVYTDPIQYQYRSLISYVIGITDPHAGPWILVLEPR